MMTILYDLFFLIFAMGYLPFMAVKRKFHPNFLQKLSFLPPEISSGGPMIWIHAVSVGEASLAIRLAREVKRRTDLRVAVSTTTITGQSVLAKDRTGAVDERFYYPFDLSVVVKRTVKAIRPRLYVMIETELWPNLLGELKRCGIPVLLANGRISDSSYKNYSKIGFFVRRILSCIDSFCMQTGKDAEKVMALGTSQEKVKITGNMKFDEPLRAGERALDRTRYLGPGEGKIIVAGSTHFPEELFVLDVFSQLKKSFSGLKLVLAPRHIERSEALRVQIRKRHLSWRDVSEISELQDKADNVDVLLVDTIGHLKELYSLADVAFIGGSLVQKGGQNPIEAALWGKPVLFGPHMSNFREVSQRFLESGAARQVQDAEDLQEALRELLSDDRMRMETGGKAVEMIRANQGALEKTFQEVFRHLSSGGS